MKIWGILGNLGFSGGLEGLEGLGEAARESSGGAFRKFWGDFEGDLGIWNPWGVAQEVALGGFFGVTVPRGGLGDNGGGVRTPRDPPVTPVFAPPRQSPAVLCGLWGWL